jgi:hypothetical protein
MVCVLAKYTTLPNNPERIFRNHALSSTALQDGNNRVSAVLSVIVKPVCMNIAKVKIIYQSKQNISTVKSYATGCVLQRVQVADPSPNGLIRYDCT